MIGGQVSCWMGVAPVARAHVAVLPDMPGDHAPRQACPSRVGWTRWLAPMPESRGCLPQRLPAPLVTTPHTVQSFTASAGRSRRAHPAAGDEPQDHRGDREDRTDLVGRKVEAERDDEGDDEQHQQYRGNIQGPATDVQRRASDVKGILAYSSFHGVRLPGSGWMERFISLFCRIRTQSWKDSSGDQGLKSFEAVRSWKF